MPAPEHPNAALPEPHQRSRVWSPRTTPGAGPSARPLGAPGAGWPPAPGAPRGAGPTSPGLREPHALSRGNRPRFPFQREHMEPSPVPREGPAPPGPDTPVAAALSRHSGGTERAPGSGRSVGNAPSPGGRGGGEAAPEPPRTERGEREPETPPEPKHSRGGSAGTALRRR